MKGTLVLCLTVDGRHQSQEEETHAQHGQAGGEGCRRCQRSQGPEVLPRCHCSSHKATPCHCNHENTTKIPCSVVKVVEVRRLSVSEYGLR
ncbi:hypothetical protein E2C01_007864 [Portunus trituberculatus]|uniref:Uncharacterized protein n=1 Tax=Portunus trituberculatus TaxID=210409 RepID=A0A5B7D1K0_PORTR|nr:hypothetical protein [Portunus trituberculatus]